MFVVLKLLPSWGGVYNFFPETLVVLCDYSLMLISSNNRVDVLDNFNYC